jgi:transposase
MIDYETYSRIKSYEKEGLNAGQIADKLSLDSRTIKRWLLAKTYHQRQGFDKKSKLDPYKEEIVNLLERHSFTATQIYQRIKESGFQGGYTTVREYVRKVRPKRPAAFLSLAFAPGECAQVDWGIYKTIDVGSSRRKLNFFVMVLSHSRMIYVEFSLAQSMEHFLSCHQHAFEFFGGVPENIMIDNLKTGVIRRITGQDIVFNPKYADFAQHYGFTIKACGVRKGNEKGRVENGVGYVKKNFLNGLEMTQFEALNPAIKTWMDTIANVRIHGETRQKPVDLWQEDINKFC